jgi:amidohydrolase
MDASKLKETVCTAIDNKAEEIIEFGEELLKTPETGFKEVNTAAQVAEKFRYLGLEPKEKLAVTGVTAEMEASKDGPTVALLGELDALLCAGHPFEDPDTSAAHACGHNIQLAIMVGAAIGLLDSDALVHLSGGVKLMAVPAEELVEVEERMEMRAKGMLEYLSGKSEFIRLGVMDNVDMAMMIHTMGGFPDRKSRVMSTNNGCLAKTIRYVGKKAHAGAFPQRGINALNAANLGLMGIHMLRETFNDDDHIRVHPIITKGGDMVNVVPDDVRIETFVRGSTVEAIMETNHKVDKALQAGAMAIGAEVVINDIPGYLPIINNQRMAGLFKENIAMFIGAENVVAGGHVGGSTDMGDLSQIMPVIHPYTSGVEGVNHEKDFQVDDPQMAYVIPAKAAAMTIIDLLYGDAEKAADVLNNYSPAMKKEEYLDFLSSIYAHDK